MGGNSSSGRHNEYTPEIGEWICSLVANSTQSIKALQKSIPDFPDKSTVYKWIREQPIFSYMYYKAKSDQSQRMIEETDDMIENDVIRYQDKDGNEKIDSASVSWVSARAHHRRWQVARLAPKVYGDAKSVEEVISDNAKLKAELETVRKQLLEQSTKEY